MKKIISISIKKELQNAYLEYAMSVIIRRAIPDCRDGLKLVHRRILFAMYKSKNYLIYKKSAKIVGDVMGRFHPHGDSAIYSAVIRMSRDFLLQSPLISGQGNFGSSDGESAAQMRYTEIKLSKTAKYLLEDTNKNIVEFQSNYDSTEFEPKVLPAQFPNLIVNGATGIAVGMATNIPTNNLKEVINYCINEIENEDKEKLKTKKAIIPDFPTRGEIINYRETIKSLLKGKGNINIRGKIILETQKNKKKLVIQEIPYQVSKGDMINSMAALNKSKIIDNINTIKDETNKLGVRIVLEIKSSCNVEILINEIFSKTKLQSNFCINMLSLDYGKATILGMNRIINTFISFRKNTIKKKIRFLLTRSKRQIHTLLACIVAAINLDEIIVFIKQSINSSVAEKNLIKNKWKMIKINSLNISSIKIHNRLATYLTLQQSKEVLNLKLGSLSFLEKSKIIDEIANVFFSIKNYTKNLVSKKKINFIIRKNFIEIKSAIALPRKTIINNQNNKVENFYSIKKKSMIITLTRDGLVKKIPLQLYKTQERGGKGKSSIKMYKDDIAIMSLITYENSTLLFFSSIGKVYKIKVIEIPLSNITTKGNILVKIIPLKEKEQIRSILNIPIHSPQWNKLNILFITKKGKIIKKKLNEFKKIKRNGKITMKLKNDDRLMSVDICSSNSNVLLATLKGKAIKFSSQSIKMFKSRISQGLKAMKINHKIDSIVSMSILSSKDFCSNKDCNYREYILTITRQGYGKRTFSSDYKQTRKNNLGVINISTCSRNGNVVSSFAVYRNEEIILMTTLGKIIRINVNKIRVTNRNTKGVKVITLRLKEEVVSASIVSKNS